MADSSEINQINNQIAHYERKLADSVKEMPSTLYNAKAEVERYLNNMISGLRARREEVIKATETAKADVAYIALQEQHKHEVLSKEEHAHFESFMHKDIDEKNVDGVIAWINKHPDAVESDKAFSHIILSGSPEAIHKTEDYATRHPESVVGQMVQRLDNNCADYVACDDARNDPDKLTLLQNTKPGLSYNYSKLPAADKENMHQNVEKYKAGDKAPLWKQVETIKKKDDSKTLVADIDKKSSFKNISPNSLDDESPNAEISSAAPELKKDPNSKLDPIVAGLSQVSLKQAPEGKLTAPLAYATVTNSQPSKSS